MCWGKVEPKCKPWESGLTEKQGPWFPRGLIDAGTLVGTPPSFSDQVTLLPRQQAECVEPYPSARLCVASGHHCEGDSVDIVPFVGLF